MSPDEPLAPMTEVAVGLHEVFVSLVEGGFAEEQALSILARVIYLHQIGSSDDG